VLALYFPFVAWIWAGLARSVGGEISFRGACRVWFLSQMGKYVPGKVWYAMGRLYLSRESGLGIVPATASTLLEILLVLLSAGAVFLVSLPLWPSPARGELVWIPIAVVLLALLVHPKIFALLLGLAARALRREVPPVRLTWSGLAWNTARYAGSWILYGAGIDFLLRGIRMDGASAEIALGAPGRILFIAGSAAVAWSLGFLSLFAPGGLGVREASFAYCLSMHLAAPLPVLLALVARLWIVVGEVGSAAVGWRLGGGAR